MRIGFIGIGLMGLPMCKRLLQAGFSLTVWNRTPDKCIALQGLGAVIAGSVTELANNSDIIMLCVSDTKAVQSLCEGTSGLLNSVQPGTVIIDFSSIAPDVTRQMATFATRKSAEWIDCPVSGGVVGADAGTLVMMAGGSAATLERVRPLLEPLCSRITYMGTSGAGQVSKICNQLIVAANAVLIAEAVALAEKSGVDASKLATALAGGFADSKPFQILAPRMSERRFEPLQWRVKTLVKDLTMGVNLGHEVALPHSLATHALDLLSKHQARGTADHDLSTLIQLFSEMPSC